MCDEQTLKDVCREASVTLKNTKLMHIPFFKYYKIKKTISYLKQTLFSTLIGNGPLHPSFKFLNNTN